jgi:hypothetical protein
MYKMWRIKQQLSEQNKDMHQLWNEDES